MFKRLTFFGQTLNPKPLNPKPYHVEPCRLCASVSVEIFSQPLRLRMETTLTALAGSQGAAEAILHEARNERGGPGVCARRRFRVLVFRGYFWATFRVAVQYGLLTIRPVFLL